MGLEGEKCDRLGRTLGLVGEKSDRVGWRTVRLVDEKSDCLQDWGVCR